MSTLVEKQIHLGEVLNEDEVQSIPCVAVFSDGKTMQLWKGPFTQSKILEIMASRGDIHLIKLAVGASEVTYWVSKFQLIKMQWERDAGWRAWIQSRLSTFKK
ncbi:MAG: hypothetical protein WED05_11075 [Candidatus Atabeyarchaeum deiterrae]